MTTYTIKPLVWETEECFEGAYKATVTLCDVYVESIDHDGEPYGCLRWAVEEKGGAERIYEGDAPTIEAAKQAAELAYRNLLMEALEEVPSTT